LSQVRSAGIEPAISCITRRGHWPAGCSSWPHSRGPPISHAGSTSPGTPQAGRPSPRPSQADTPEAGQPLRPHTS